MLWVPHFLDVRGHCFWAGAVLADAIQKLPYRLNDLFVILLCYTDSQNPKLLTRMQSVQPIQRQQYQLLIFLP